MPGDEIGLGGPRRVRRAGEREGDRGDGGESRGILEDGGTDGQGHPVTIPTARRPATVQQGGRDRYSTATSSGTPGPKVVDSVAFWM